MRIIEWFNNLFHKKKVILRHCSCGQNVDILLYRKKTKTHKIGYVNYINGKVASLYCDGSEK